MAQSSVFWYTNAYVTTEDSSRRSGANDRSLFPVSTAARVYLGRPLHDQCTHMFPSAQPPCHKRNIPSPEYDPACKSQEQCYPYLRRFHRRAAPIQPCVITSRALFTSSEPAYSLRSDWDIEA